MMSSINPIHFNLAGYLLDFSFAIFISMIPLGEFTYPQNPKIERLNYGIKQIKLYSRIPAKNNCPSPDDHPKPWTAYFFSF